jgi:O-antigen ligase
MKLSFLLFPIIFFTFKTKIKFQTVIQFFITSMVIIVSILLIHAAFKSIYYPEDNHWAYFFESEFTGRMHRSYFATYTAIASVFSLLVFMKNRKKNFYLFAFFLMTIATVLTISKAGILILNLCLLIVFIHKMIQLKKWIFLAFGSVSIIVGITLLVSLSERVSSRFTMISKAINEVKLYHNPDSESNEARLIMWNTSIQLIKGHPILGFGTGDVKDVLIAKNIEMGNTGVAEKKLNAHNQYLNTWVQLGVFGLISLLMFFATVFYLAKKEKNMYLFYFGLILFLSLLTESFLETQAGIIPVGLLSFALLSTRPQVD